MSILPGNALLSGTEPGPRPGTVRKNRPKTLEKRTLYQNSPYELKTHFFTNSRVFISNMTIFFDILP